MKTKRANYSTILFSGINKDIIITEVKNSVKKQDPQLVKRYYIDNKTFTPNIIRKISFEKDRLAKNKSNLNVPLYLLSQPSYTNRNNLYKNSQNEKKTTKLNEFKIPKLKKKTIEKKNVTKKRCESHIMRYMGDVLTDEYIPPYKQYLKEHHDIDNTKKIQELEQKFVKESEKIQEAKLLNYIKSKLQAYDFGKQKSREFFLKKYLDSKNYNKKCKSYRKNVLFKKIDNISKKNDDFDKIFDNKGDSRKYLKEQMNYDRLLSTKTDFVYTSGNITGHYPKFKLKLRKFMDELEKSPELNYKGLIQ